MPSPNRGQDGRLFEAPALLPSGLLFDSILTSLDSLGLVSLAGFVVAAILEPVTVASTCPVRLIESLQRAPGPQQRTGRLVESLEEKRMRDSALALCHPPTPDFMEKSHIVKCFVKNR